MTDDRKNKVICISALKNYKEWKKDIKEKIEDTQAIRAIDYSKDRADCVSDMTPGNIKALERILDSKQYKWVSLIDEMMQSYEGTCNEKIIILMFFQRESAEKTCQELNYSRRTIFLIRDEILTRLEKCAIARGVLTYAI